MRPLAFTGSRPVDRRGCRCWGALRRGTALGARHLSGWEGRRLRFTAPRAASRAPLRVPAVTWPPPRPHGSHTRPGATSAPQRRGRLPQVRCPACTVISDLPKSSLEQVVFKERTRLIREWVPDRCPSCPFASAALTTFLQQAQLRRPASKTRSMKGQTYTPPGGTAPAPPAHPAGAAGSAGWPSPGWLSPGCLGPKSHCQTPSGSPRGLRRHSLPSGLCWCPGSHMDPPPPLTGWDSPSPPRSRAPPTSSALCPVSATFYRKMKKQVFQREINERCC